MQVHGMGSSRSAPKPPSALVSSLLRNYFAGQCSASAIQEICYAAVKDGVQDRDVEQLAKLGQSGSHSGHMARDLESCLRTSPLGEALAKVPLKILLNDRTVEAIHRILVPHRIFALMWLHGSSQFEKFFFDNDRTRLRDFWMSLPPHRRPAAEHLDTTIPLKFFGDGVAVLGLAKSWSKTMHAFLMSPLLSGVSGKDGQLLLTVLWKAKLAPGAYMRFWNLIAWSLETLDRGVWPHEDMFGRAFPPGSEASAKAGTPLANNWRARVVTLTETLNLCILATVFRIQTRCCHAANAAATVQIDHGPTHCCPLSCPQSPPPLGGLKTPFGGLWLHTQALKGLSAQSFSYP